MRFDWALGVICFFVLICAAFLCLFTVRERLTLPFARAMLIVTLLIAALSALMALGDEAMSNLVVLLALVPCFYVYQKITQESRGKLLFVFFVVATYVCFASALRLAVGSLMPQDDPLFARAAGHTGVGSMLVDSALTVAFAIPAAFLLRDRIWPLIRDLEMAEWNSIWIVPMIYALVIPVFTQQMWDSALDFWAYMAGITLLGVGAFVSYFLIVNMMQNIATSARSAERARMVESQLALQREQYERIQSGIAEARKARHDLRQSLAALSGLTRQGDLGRLNDYLSQMIVQLPTESEPAVCRNMAVNAVARHYLARARDAGIAVTTRMDIPEDTGGVSQMDLCVLIGNMLENALEACTRLGEAGRHIRLVADAQGSFLTISMENSFDGVCRTRDGAILSRKRDGEIEGIGLSSIRAIAEKYQGFARFVAGDDRFETSVVVRL